jgi:hypothetical protein
MTTVGKKVATVQLNFVLWSDDTSSIKIHNSISFTHSGLQINHQMPFLRRHRQGSVGL